MEQKTLLLNIFKVVFKVAATAINMNVIPEAVPGWLQVFKAGNDEDIFASHITPDGQECNKKEAIKRSKQRTRRLVPMQAGGNDLILSGDSDPKFAGAVRAVGFDFVYSSGGKATPLQDAAVMLVILTKALVLTKDTLTRQGCLSATRPNYNAHLDQLLRACIW